MTDIIVGTNSLLSLANAHIYFGNRIGSDKWINADEENQKKVLIMGLQRLNLERYEGSRTDEAQLPPFPRIGIVDREGRSIDSKTIPQFAKDSQCEIAITILDNPAWFGDRGTEGWENLQTDGATGRPRQDYKAQELPEMVKRLLETVLYIDLGYYGIA